MATPTRLIAPSQVTVQIVSGAVRYTFPNAGDTSQSAWNTVRGQTTIGALRAARVPSVYPRTTRPLYGIEMSGFSQGAAGGGFTSFFAAIEADAASNIHAFRDALQNTVDEAKVAFGEDRLTVMLWHVTKYHSLVEDGDYPYWFDSYAFPFICPSRVSAAYTASLESWFQDLRDDGDVPGVYVGTTPQIQADTSSLIRQGVWVRREEDDEGVSMGILRNGLKWCLERGAMEIGMDIFNDFRAFRGYPAYSGGTGWGSTPNVLWNGPEGDPPGEGTYEPSIPKDEDFDLYIEDFLLNDPDIRHGRYILEPFTPLGRSRFPQLEVVHAETEVGGDNYLASTLPDLAVMRCVNPGAEVIAYIHDTPAGWGDEGEEWDATLAAVKAKGYRPASHYFAMQDAGKVSTLA